MVRKESIGAEVIVQDTKYFLFFYIMIIERYLSNRLKLVSNSWHYKSSKVSNPEKVNRENNERSLWILYVLVISRMYV